MVAIPGQFDAADDAPDPVAIERFALTGLLAAGASALQLAALNMKRVSYLEREAGNISEAAERIANESAASIEQIAAAWLETIARLQEQ